MGLRVAQQVPPSTIPVRNLFSIFLKGDLTRGLKAYEQERLSKDSPTASRCALPTLLLYSYWNLILLLSHSLELARLEVHWPRELSNVLR